MRFGAYAGDSDTGFEALESVLNYTLGVVHKYYGWGEDPSPLIAAAAPRPVMATIDLNGVSWTQIASGNKDPDIEMMIAISKAAGRPVYWRIGAEMNGNWETYFVTNAQAAACKAAFQRIGGMFHGATPNAKLVFCVNDGSSAGAAPVSSYYPGSSFIDILGIDSYAWNSAPFDTYFAPYYATWAALDTTKEVWVCETGDPATDPNQAAWAAAAVRSTKFSRLTTFIYEDDPTTSPPWTLTAATLTALKAALSGSPPPPPPPTGPTISPDTVTVTWPAGVTEELSLGVTGLPPLAQPSQFSHTMGKRPPQQTILTVMPGPIVKP